MPRFHKDEVAKLEDIEALLVTARDLVERFHMKQLEGTAQSIKETLSTMRSAKAGLIADWRASDNSH
jgi:hypothetical protein